MKLSNIIIIYFDCFPLFIVTIFIYMVIKESAHTTSRSVYFSYSLHYYMIPPKASLVLAEA